MQAPPEKLGSFYLGADYDLKSGQRSDVAVNHDARDLTTHAVSVGLMESCAKLNVIWSLMKPATPHVNSKNGSGLARVF